MAAVTSSGLPTSSFRAPASTGRTTFSATPSQNTAPVYEYTCLFTRDIKRKNQKRWQDGLLRYHSFNNKVMVYDISMNSIGSVRITSQDELQEGEELQLDSGGCLIQLGESKGKIGDTDLKDVIRQRGPKAAPLPEPTPGSTLQQRHPNVQNVISPARRQSIRTSNELHSPYDRRQLAESENSDWNVSPPAKRQRRDDHQHLSLNAILRTSRPSRTPTRPCGASRITANFGLKPAPGKGRVRASACQSTLKVQEIIDITSDSQDSIPQIDTPTEAQGDQHQESREPHTYRVDTNGRMWFRKPEGGAKQSTVTASTDKTLSRPRSTVHLVKAPSDPAKRQPSPTRPQASSVVSTDALDHRQLEVAGKSVQEPRSGQDNHLPVRGSTKAVSEDNNTRRGNPENNDPRQCKPPKRNEETVAGRKSENESEAAAITSESVIRSKPMRTLKLTSKAPRKMLTSLASIHTISRPDLGQTTTSTEKASPDSEPSDESSRMEKQLEKDQAKQKTLPASPPPQIINTMPMDVTDDCTIFVESSDTESPLAACPPALQSEAASPDNETSETFEVTASLEQALDARLTKSITTNDHDADQTEPTDQASAHPISPTRLQTNEPAPDTTKTTENNLTKQHTLNTTKHTSPAHPARPFRRHYSDTSPTKQPTILSNPHHPLPTTAQPPKRTFTRVHTLPKPASRHTPPILPVVNREALRQDAAAISALSNGEKDEEKGPWTSEAWDLFGFWPSAKEKEKESDGFERYITTLKR